MKRCVHVDLTRPELSLSRKISNKFDKVFKQVVSIAVPFKVMFIDEI